MDGIFKQFFKMLLESLHIFYSSATTSSLLHFTLFLMCNVVVQFVDLSLGSSNLFDNFYSPFKKRSSNYIFLFTKYYLGPILLFSISLLCRRLIFLSSRCTSSRFTSSITVRAWTFYTFICNVRFCCLRWRISFILFSWASSLIGSLFEFFTYFFFPSWATFAFILLALVSISINSFKRLIPRVLQLGSVITAIFILRAFFILFRLSPTCLYLIISSIVLRRGTSVDCYLHFILKSVT